MRYVINSGLAGLWLWAAVSLFGEEKPAADRVAQLDRIRLPARSFAVDLAISDYRQGKKEREGTFRLYSRRTTAGFDSLAVCLTPVADRHKLLLSKGDRLLFYDPRSARPVAVSPSQFRSHSFVLDLFAAPLSESYSAELQGDGATTDLARRQVTAERLRLTPQVRGKPLLLYWLDKDNERPLKSEVFGGNNKLLRTVFYADFKNALGEQRPMRLVVANPVENSVSEVRFSGFAYHDPPDSVFDDTQLPNAVTRLK